MYEIEYSYWLAILYGLVGGFAANCLAILTLEGRILGFSGVLTCYVGMIVLLIITHLTYIENRMPGSTCWIVLMIAMLSMAIIGSGASVIVHIYGYVFGMIIGLGFYPKHP